MMQWPERLKYLKNFVFLRKNFAFLVLICFVAIRAYNQFSALQGDSARVQIILSIITLAVAGTLLFVSLGYGTPAVFAVLVPQAYP